MDLEGGMKPLFTLFVFLVLTMFTSANAQLDGLRIAEGGELPLTQAQISAGIEGRLILELSVKENGNVSKLEVLGGPIYPCNTNPKKELQEIVDFAKAKAKSLRFEPPIENGKPVKSRVIYVFDFPESPRKKDAVARMVEPIVGGTLNSRAIKLPKPKWPPLVGQAPNLIVANVIVSEQGEVIAMGIEAGTKEFHESVRTAACKAQFRPPTVNGQPTTMTGRITYVFGDN